MFYSFFRKSDLRLKQPNWGFPEYPGEQIQDG